MRRVFRLGLVAGAAVFLASGSAWAGGSGLDEQDDADAGTPFFGFVKDLDARGRAIPDAKVVAEIKGGNASLVTRADAQGHYRITGFGKDLAFEQRQKLMFHGTKALLVSFGVQIAKAWIRRQRVVDRPLLRNFDYVRIQNVAWIV